ncbi:integral membrane protein (plasmid) [Mycobacterium liflandii 128FXT]|uniref:Integral membrane protein n=1 Tax=Mycobacterium liflandii (strain 128FXT) TaxID=459424 RepID=B6CLW0_MYCL1|nr:hypothetical protein [Mycobacterium liflandii]ACA57597.1 integral membrane protein [Mycobacterium liflandii 128FXT]
MLISGLWARLVVAPWWVRVLANGLALAGIAVVFTIGFVAHFVSQTNWAWATAAAGATGVGYGALITSVRGPIHLRFAATVAGLTVQQRGQALTALRRGDVPSDPRVVAAASRLGALVLAYGRRTHPLQWAFLGAFAAVAVVLRITHSQPGFFCLLLVYLAATPTLIWQRRLLKRLPDRLARLHAAASPAVWAAQEQPDHSTMAQQRLLSSALTGFVAGAFAVAALVGTQYVSQPQAAAGDAQGAALLLAPVTATVGR